MTTFIWKKKTSFDVLPTAKVGSRRKKSSDSKEKIRALWESVTLESRFLSNRFFGSFFSLFSGCAIVETKIFLSLLAWQEIIDNISSSGLVNAINFAGGEPLLYSDFVPLFLLCHDRGFALSIISNGSLLQNGKLFPSSLFAMLDTLGISIDSFSADTLRSLGCCSRSGKVLSRQDLQAILRLALSINPNLKVKINTVVSSINANETFPDFAHEIVLNRWKFLKIKPFSGSGKDNQSLLVSDEQFDIFCRRNMPKTGIGIAEREMKNSYIIINNQGNLLDSSSLSYSVIGNLLEEPFEDILDRFAFDKKEYEQRYGKKKETDFFDSSSTEKHDF